MARECVTPVFPRECALCRCILTRAPSMTSTRALQCVRYGQSLISSPTLLMQCKRFANPLCSPSTHSLHCNKYWPPTCRGIAMEDVYNYYKLMRRSGVRGFLFFPPFSLPHQPPLPKKRPTHEFYLHEGPGQYAGGDEDRSDENQAYRRPIRDKLMAILQPAEDKMTRFVREHFPELCAKKGKDHVCMPCYSLIRRYMPDERQTHMMHRDGQALVTVVVSLSTYGKDFKGGLYVAVNGAQR